MTGIQEILERHPEASSWQQEYPWFSIGHLVAARQNNGKPDFETIGQPATFFTNNIPRLHWLLSQPHLAKENLPVESVAISNDSEDTSDHTSPLSTPEEQKSTAIDTIAQEPLLDKSTLLQDFETHPQFAPDLSEAPEQEEAVPDESGSVEPQLSQPPLSSSLAAAAGSFKDTLAVDDSLLFETAYQHTIDYFASQGIRLEGEPAQDDRFGQQLKTFTSWLRQMKPLPKAQEQDADLLVQTNAAHSLQKGEITTESMVDVLLKQGKKQQAIQLLEKLRLLHPEKSLYFAARCEQIKHSK